MNTNFDAEIEPILFVLEQLLCRPNEFKNVVFLVDSKSAVQYITSNRNITSKAIHGAIKLIRIKEILQIRKSMQCLFTFISTYRKQYWVCSVCVSKTTTSMVF